MVSSKDELVEIYNSKPLLGKDFLISNNIFLDRKYFDKLPNPKNWKEFKYKIDNEYNLETVLCACCNSSKFILLSNIDKKKIPVSFVMCSVCGLVQLNPRFNQESYNDWYDHLYMNLWEVTTSLDYTFDLVEKFKSKYKYIKKYIKPKSKILEIGCNSGEVLNFLHNEGYDVYGVDYHKEAINLAKKLTPEGNFFNGGIELLRSYEGKFNCIYMNDLFEHIVNPVTYVGEIKKLLSPGGIIFVSIPGFRNWINYKRGNIWTTIQFAHIYYYSKIHLKQIFSKNNLKHLFIDNQINAIFINNNEKLKLESSYNLKFEFFVNYYFILKIIFFNFIKKNISSFFKRSNEYTF